MDHDQTSKYDFGEFLVYTESGWEPDLEWHDLPDPLDYELKISLEVNQ